MVKLIPGTNDLGTTHPKLAAEWHPTKNGDLTPARIIAGSNKKVWWLGSCGHEWQAQPANRKNGTGCPYCSNNKVLPGFNDLATLRPDLAAEWHPTKNGDLTPRDVTKSAAKIVWWQCTKGHEWQVSINGRGSNSRGCPVCGKTKMVTNRLKTIIENNGSLVDTNPELAAEWHPTKNGALLPTQVTENSNKRVWWLAPCGHEWKININARSSGRNCPICAGKQIQIGFNDLLTTHPTLAPQWHPTKNGDLTPEMVTAGSNKKVWWQCDEGHEWEVSICNRVKGTGCPYCSGRYAIPGETDLVTHYPQIAAEWHPTKNGDLLPSDVKPNSNKKVWWQCEKGHEWETTIYSRIAGTRCPVCWGESQTSFPEQAILYYCQEVASAESRNTEFGKEMDVWLPDLRVGIEYNGWWHKVRTVQDAKKLRFFADLGIRIITVKEGEENRIDGDTIEYVYSNNKDSLNWAISSIFHLLQLPSPLIDSAADAAKIYERYIFLEKENSLASKYPDVAAEWHPTKNGELTPDLVKANSHKKVWWLGTCGHEWDMTIANRTTLGQKCPICANQRILIGFNDLATTYPDIARQWHPTKNGALTPSQVIPGTTKKVWWLGKCGHEWEAMINKRTIRGNNCPYCSNHRLLPGFNDLATVRPDIAVQWHPTKNGTLTPNQVLPGSDTRVWWICAERHEWEAMVSKRNAERGCPICARRRKRK